MTNVVAGPTDNEARVAQRDAGGRGAEPVDGGERVADGDLACQRDRARHVEYHRAVAAGDSLAQASGSRVVEVRHVDDGACGASGVEAPNP